MTPTEHYRKHHEELLELAKQISQGLVPEILTKDATEARTLLSVLIGKLKVHLAMEDKSLYPRLMEHADNKIREMTMKFSSEMGAIGATVMAYNDRWLNKTRIQETPDAFIKETREIFTVLAGRIDRENNELYSVVDRANITG